MEKIRPAYQVRKTKDEYKIKYKGDLKDVLEKAKIDLDKKKNDSNIKHWEWLKDKAIKEIETNKIAIEKIEAVILAATKELSNEERR